MTTHEIVPTDKMKLPYGAGEARMVTWAQLPGNDEQYVHRPCGSGKSCPARRMPKTTTTLLCW